MKFREDFFPLKKCFVVTALSFSSLVFMVPYFERTMEVSGVQKQWGVIRNLAVPEGYYKGAEVCAAYEELERVYKRDIETGRCGVIPEWRVFDFLSFTKSEKTDDILWEAWKRNPIYCIKRAIVAFPIFALGNEQVAAYVSPQIFRAWPAKMKIVFPELTESWQMRTVSNPIGAFYFSLLPFYKVINFAILFFLPCSFFIGIVKRDYFCIFSSFLIFSFLSMYAFSLFALDRYAVPAFLLGYFLLVRTLFLGGEMMVNRLKRKWGIR